MKRKEKRLHLAQPCPPQIKAEIDSLLDRFGRGELLPADLLAVIDPTCHRTRFDPYEVVGRYLEDRYPGIDVGDWDLRDATRQLLFLYEAGLVAKPSGVGTARSYELPVGLVKKTITNRTIAALRAAKPNISTIATYKELDTLAESQTPEGKALARERKTSISNMKIDSIELQSCREKIRSYEDVFKYGGKRVQRNMRSKFSKQKKKNS